MDRERELELASILGEEKQRENTHLSLSLGSTHTHTLPTYAEDLRKIRGAGEGQKRKMNG